MPGATEAQVRARTAQIGFPGLKADTPVGDLSGGEKARLLMGLATFGGPHLLILDEPTNHLDIDSREALVQALNEFPGAVILISHDRHLLEACVDRLWLVADGTVKPFDGDMEDYRAARARRRRRAPRGLQSPAGTRRGNGAAAARGTRRPTAPRIRQIEEAMDRLHAIIADLDEKLSRPGLFERAPEKAARWRGHAPTATRAPGARPRRLGSRRARELEAVEAGS